MNHHLDVIAASYNFGTLRVIGNAIMPNVILTTENAINQVALVHQSNYQMISVNLIATLKNAVMMMHAEFQVAMLVDMIC